MKPKHETYIDLLRSVHVIDKNDIDDNQTFGKYSCKYLSTCKHCPYLLDNKCDKTRISDFPQSLEYHRKTYPEDFV